MATIPDSCLSEADAIVVVECDVPWLPNKKAPNASCPVIQIATDSIYTNYPIRGFAADVTISGSLAASLNALADALEEYASSAKARIGTRLKRLAQVRAAQREKWQASLKMSPPGAPMNIGWISHCVDRVKGADGILLRDGGRLRADDVQ